MIPFNVKRGVLSVGQSIGETKIVQLKLVVERAHLVSLLPPVLKSQKTGQERQEKKEQANEKPLVQWQPASMT